LSSPLYPHEAWKRGAAGALLCAGWGRYSIFKPLFARPLPLRENANLGLRIARSPRNWKMLRQEELPRLPLTFLSFREHPCPRKGLTGIPPRRL